jgi:hypothetical protein
MTETRPVQTRRTDTDPGRNPNDTQRSQRPDPTMPPSIREPAGQTTEPQDAPTPDTLPSRFPASDLLLATASPPVGGQAVPSALTGVSWEARCALTPQELFRGEDADGYPLPFLLRHIDPGDGCWIWRPAGGVDFPKVRVLGELLFAHRFVFEIAFGPVPDGLAVLKRCGRRRCVAPAHLVAAPKRFEKRLDELPTGTAFFAG